uniref:ABC transmembrane type-1 domain-containing protein n=1 Tax=Macrostomum lignano TaxID=282301 RepID=A0A1I8I481_9PLAT
MLNCLVFINSLAFVAGGFIICLGVWILLATDSLMQTLASFDKSLKSGISIEKLFDIIEAKGLYKLVLLCLLAGQMIFTAVLLLKKPTIEKQMRIMLLKAQAKYFVARTQYFNQTGDLRISHTRFFEHMHISFKCCGVAKPHDIVKSASYQRSRTRDPDFNEVLPASCCKISNRGEALADLAPLMLPCIAPVSRLVDKLTLPGLIMSGIFILVLLSKQPCARRLARLPAVNSDRIILNNKLKL